jgi:hypothetical protein
MQEGVETVSEPYEDEPSGFPYTYELCACGEERT